jgi:ABC-type nitrate/sulfonate/bicarbonate transport system ATPase subunit
MERTKKTIISVTHDPREAACLGSCAGVHAAARADSKEIRVNLPRPRDINAESVGNTRAQIMTELESKADEKPAG